MTHRSPHPRRPRDLRLAASIRSRDSRHAAAGWPRGRSWLRIRPVVRLVVAAAAGVAGLCIVFVAVAVVARITALPSPGPGTPAVPRPPTGGAGLHGCRVEPGRQPRDPGPAGSAPAAPLSPAAGSQVLAGAGPRVSRASGPTTGQPAGPGRSGPEPDRGLVSRRSVPWSGCASARRTRRCPRPGRTRPTAGPPPRLAGSATPPGRSRRTRSGK
jgi:hypothetical protein